MLKRRYGLLASLLVLFLANSAFAAASLTLGNAASFAALSTSKSVSIGKGAGVTGFVGGTSVTLGTGSGASSDVIANPKGITVGKGAGVGGTCVTGGAKIVVKSGATCVGTDNSGSNPDLITMTAAISDLATFESDLAATAATEALGKQVVAKGATLVVDDLVAGQNVITADSITLKAGASLTLTGTGGSGETMILNISGKLSMSATSQIVLSGLTASQVLINVGKSLTLPKNVGLSGTFVVANGSCTLGANSGLEGAMLCGKKVTVGASAGLSLTPFGPTITPPTAWNLTGSLTVGRHMHTQTTLADGRVLVAGGVSNNNTTVEASAELYDATGTAATLTGSMATGRSGHTATLLPNGKVLIAGGQDILGNFLTSAELYDPTTGLFSTTGSLGIARAAHTATLLASGKVLIAGGDTTGGTPIKETELYDPTAGTFGGVSNMNVARDSFVTGVFVGGPLDGKVIVAGGNSVSSTTTVTAELFDPLTNTFSTTGSMSFARARGVGAILSNGKFMVAGGGVGDSEDGASTELYDPTSGTFSLSGTMNAAHETGTATILPDGLVVVTGGNILPTGNITDITNFYDPNTDTVVAGLVRMKVPREELAASLLTNGQVLVTGGFPSLASAELLH